MRRNKFIDMAKQMPPLYHKLPGQDFDIKKSCVIRWLLEHKETYDYILRKLQRSGAIKYNSDTNMWQGVDFEE